MKRLRWIEDSTPSADAKILALRQVENIRKIMSRTKLQSAQKIWTDGTFFFHYKVSKFMNQIRVWSDDVLLGKLRFWVIQEGTAYGLFEDNGTWGKVEISDLAVFPGPGTYSWHGTDKTIIKNKSIVAPARHFFHQYQPHIPNYARFGEHIFVHIDVNAFLELYDLFMPAMSDAAGSINRETLQATASPYQYSPDALEIAGDPLPWSPYPDLTIISAVKRTLSPQGLDYPYSYSAPVAPTSYFQVPSGDSDLQQYMIDDLEVVQLENDLVIRNAYAFLYDDLSAYLRCFYDVVVRTNLTGTGAIVSAALSYHRHDNTPPYAKVFNFLSYTLGTASSSLPSGWKYGISGFNVYEIRSTISSVKRDGSKVVGILWQTFDDDYRSGDLDLPIRTPRNWEYDVDHSAQTIDAVELSPQYQEDVDHSSTVTTSTPPGYGGRANSLYNGVSDHSELTTMSGWGYGDNDTLYEAKITCERIESVDYTNNTVNTSGGTEGGTGHDLTEVTDTIISVYEWYYEIKFYMRGILIWTHITETRKANYHQAIISYRYTTHTPATPTLTAGSTDLTSEEFIDLITPEIIIHDIDLYSDSASITIIEREDIYDDGAYTIASGLAGDYTRTGTSTEKTRVRGNDLADQVYTAVTDVIAGSAMSIGGQVGAIDEPAGDYTSSKDDFVLVPGSDVYPESFADADLETPFKFYSTGMTYRFLTDHDGNTLAYCPTGQEAYWDLDGDSADTPPAKWRLARPHIFKLYDSAGAEISLSGLGLTNVENIGICDRIFSSDEI